MNTEIKENWVAALENDKYKQATGSLRTPEDRFCCLGVLCDIVDPEGWERRYGNAPGGGWWTYNSNASALTKGMLLQIDMDESFQWMLIEKNDHGDSFKKIAVWIRENL